MPKKRSIQPGAILSIGATGDCDPAHRFTNTPATQQTQKYPAPLAIPTPSITYLSANLSPKRQHSELLGQEITELYGQSA